MDLPEYLCVDATQRGLCAKIDCLTTGGIKEYDQLARDTLDLTTWPPLPQNALVEQAFAAGLPDLGRKALRRDYYVSNCICFLTVIAQVTDTQTRTLLESADSDGILLRNYSQLLQGLLFDSMLVLNEYSALVKGSAPLVALAKTSRLHPLQLWHFARQVAFGQVSCHAYADPEPDVSAAVIRLAIEVRLRQGTGIAAKRHRSDPRNMQPVKLSSIIQAVADHQQSIILPVPTANINRIYQWANTFIHSGSRMGIYTWLPHIALEYLKPFLIGTQANGCWDSKNGMRYSSATLAAIRQRTLELESPRGRICLLRRLIRRFRGLADTWELCAWEGDVDAVIEEA